MYIKTTYDSEFEDLFMYLKSKYPQKLFDLEGIGEQTDMSLFSKKFFSTKSNVADKSVDSNANVDDTSIIAYENELTKPYFRLNSLYLTWKYLKQLYGHATANEAIEAQLTGDIYINDFTGVNKPYSYYAETLLHVKINDVEKMLKMSDLYSLYSENEYDIKDGKEIISFTLNNKLYSSKNKVEVLDENNSWVDVTRILKHKRHNNLLVVGTKNGYSTIITEDHPVILEDGSEVVASELKIGQKLRGDTVTKNKFRETKNAPKDLAYLIGFFIGDGSYAPWGIVLHQNNIKNSKIKNHVEALGFSCKSIKNRPDRYNVYSTDLKKFFLKDMMIGEHAQHKSLPIDIFDYDSIFAGHLLAGLVDSDGTVNPDNGMISIRVCSYSLVQGVKELLKSMNINSTISTGEVPKASTNTFRSQYEIYGVNFRLNKDTIKLFIESEKIQNNLAVVSQEKYPYIHWDDNSVKYIRKLTGKHNNLFDAYVYDITTSSGHFYSQGLIQHNCYNFSTYDVMVHGLPFVNKIKSSPAKHLSSFIGQLVHFSVYASNSVLGAVGLADFIIVSSYYVDKMLKENQNVPDTYLWKQIKQEFQSFIFSCNQPFRGGVQSGFYNISIYDDLFLDKMCSEYIFPDGSAPDKALINLLQELYLDLMNETLKSTPITFPVTTACFSIDENKEIIDKNFLSVIAEKNQDYGFINFYCGETSTLSSCCRLRSSTKNEYFNQFGAGGTKIGSLGVVTVNIPRLAIKSEKNEEVFFKELERISIMAIRINNTKRHLLKKRIDGDSLPLYSLGFMDLKTQYSTVGVMGINESCVYMGYNILEESGQSFVIKILDLINDLNDKATKRYGSPHNMEQVPAENSAIKLAQKDKMLGYQTDYDLYSNQFIPLTTNADLLDRITLQGMFDSKMSGGAIAHLNIEQQISDVKPIKDLISTAAKTGVVYCAINYNLQKCINEHMTVGKGDSCSICNGTITDNFTRVVGFLVNTKNFHQIRREQDYPNRVFYRDLK